MKAKTMKKISFLTGVLCALAFASCNNEPKVVLGEDSLPAVVMNIIDKPIAEAEDYLVKIHYARHFRGLDEIDNKLLCTIIDKFRGGPVGLNTIATAMGEDPGTIEDVYEPYLIKEGFIKRTPRGREATELAYRHLGKERILMGQDGPTLF